MSDGPGTYYVTTALVLIALPGALALYDPASGLTLLLLCAAMLYLLALAILAMCFWCRWKYGEWPLFTFTSSSTAAPRVTWADAFRQRRIGRRGRS